VTPTFSVVMPAYNRADSILRAMQSVLGQTPSLELIVVDDGSTDATADVVRSIDDVRVRLVSQPNAGVSAARNAGARLAGGTYLVFLDSDDEALPTWLEELQGPLDGGADIVVCGRLIASADRKTWRAELPHPCGPSAAGVSLPFLPGCVAMRTAAFMAIGGYVEEIRYSENTELLLRTAERVRAEGWRVETVDQALVVFYRRADRGYVQERHDAARYLLEHHRARLGRAPSQLASYYGIAGTTAAHLGERREALRSVMTAIRVEPAALRSWRRLGGVVLRRTEAADEPAPAATTLDRTPLPIHAVIVTFDRPDELADQLGAISGDGVVTSITVVDNGSDDRAAEVSKRHNAAHLRPGENVGPAGGFAVGIDHLLAEIEGDAWVALLDDDDPPPSGSTDEIAELARFGDWLLGRGVPVGAVGMAGSRFDRRTGRLRRPTDRELVGPVAVDYIAGGQLPLMRAAAVREAGGFRTDLFFGLEELDQGLRLSDAGFRSFGHGALWYEARRRAGRLGPRVGVAPRKPEAWRRYYAVRNLIVISRAHVGSLLALRVSLEHLLGRPVMDLLRRRPERSLLWRLGAKGVADAWFGRMGRRVEPLHEPRDP
jgi:GT2 family glycosyltransferase